MSRRALFVWLAPLSTVLALAGCGGGSATGTPGGGGAGGAGGGPAVSGPCAAKMSECLGDQRACVADEGGKSAHCELCPESEYASPESGSCTAIEGKKYGHDFAEFTSQPGEEVLGLCQSWTLNNDEEIWVNTVEMAQDEASHHSNWMYMPDTLFEGPDGVWPCDERHYSQSAAVLQGGVLYAQSTQATKEVQRFPGHAAYRIPPHARVIGDVHLLNVTNQPITGHARLNIYGMPSDEVKIKLAPFHLSFETLDIPPHARSRTSAECLLEDQFQNVLSSPVKMKVYYLLPHTHGLGTRFFIDVIGGPSDGKSVLDVLGPPGEARGRGYDPPFDLAGMKGLRFGCEFDNPRAEAVHWGFGDQEMCEVLGFAEMRAAFESIVDAPKAAGADGEVQLYSGPCATPLFVPWSN